MTSNDILSAWLREKSSYISGFLDKWVQPAMENPQPFLNVVRYEEINSFIVTLLSELREHLPDGTKERIDAFVLNNVDGQFRGRQNPFHAPSEKLAAYLDESCHAFVETANKIIAANLSGVMKPYGVC